MKLVIVAIRDVKTAAYMVPVFFLSTGQALRWFGDLVNDRQTDVGKHPEDYALWSLGGFDQQAGTVIPIEQPFILQTATQALGEVGK